MEGETKAFQPSIWDLASIGDDSLLKILDRGAVPVDYRCSLGTTCLHRACSAGHYAIAKQLIERGADVNAADGESGWTPLHRALYHRHLKLTGCLLLNGATLRGVTDHDGFTPLAMLSAMLEKGLAEGVQSRRGGDVYTFGKCEMQLGYSTSRSTQRVPKLVRGVPNVVSIAASRHHTAVLTANGELYTFGTNRYGRLGHGDEVTRTTPTLVAGLKGRFVAVVAAGENHTLAVTHRGELFSWGCDRFGQLGLGSKSEPGVSPSHPVPKGRQGRTDSQNASALPSAAVEALSTTPPSFVPTTDSSPLVFSERKTPRACGGGASVASGRHTVPRRVKIGRGNSVRVVGVAASASHSACVTDDGQVFTWGCNAVGQLGNRDPQETRRKQLGLPRSVTLTRHVGVRGGNGQTGGASSSAACTLSGGYSSSYDSTCGGGLGRFASSPLAASLEGGLGGLWSGLASKVPHANRVTQVDASEGATIVVTQSGRVFQWGLGVFYPTRVHLSERKSKRHLRRQRRAFEEPTSESDGGYTSSECTKSDTDTGTESDAGFRVFKLDDDLLGSGCGGAGKGSSFAQTDPSIGVAMGSHGAVRGRDPRGDKKAHVVQVALGESHAVAVTARGILYTWGTADPEILGHSFASVPSAPVAARRKDACGVAGSTAPSSSHVATPCRPKRVVALKGRHIVQAACGRHHTCAVDSNGGLFCWGRTNHGVAGVPVESESSAPSALATRSSKSAAFCTGEGCEYRGRATSDVETSPLAKVTSTCEPQMNDMLQRVSAVACGDSHTVALVTPSRPKVPGVFENRLDLLSHLNLDSEPRLPGCSRRTSQSGDIDSAHDNHRFERASSIGELLGLSFEGSLDDSGVQECDDNTDDGIEHAEGNVEVASLQTLCERSIAEGIQIHTVLQLWGYAVGLNLTTTLLPFCEEFIKENLDAVLIMCPEAAEYLVELGQGDDGLHGNSFGDSGGERGADATAWGFYDPDADGGAEEARSQRHARELSRRSRSPSKQLRFSKFSTEELSKQARRLRKKLRKVDTAEMKLAAIELQQQQADSNGAGGVAQQSSNTNTPERVEGNAENLRRRRTELTGQLRKVERELERRDDYDAEAERSRRRTQADRNGTSLSCYTVADGNQEIQQAHVKQDEKAASAPAEENQSSIVNDGKDLYCELCRVRVSDRAAMFEHLSGRRHKKREKAKCQGSAASEPSNLMEPDQSVSQKSEACGQSDPMPFDYATDDDHRVSQKQQCWSTPTSETVALAESPPSPWVWVSPLQKASPAPSSLRQILREETERSQKATVSAGNSLKAAKRSVDSSASLSTLPPVGWSTGGRAFVDQDAITATHATTPEQQQRSSGYRNGVVSAGRARGDSGGSSAAGGSAGPSDVCGDKFALAAFMESGRGHRSRGQGANGQQRVAHTSGPWAVPQPSRSPPSRPVGTVSDSPPWGANVFSGGYESGMVGDSGAVSFALPSSNQQHNATSVDPGARSLREIQREQFQTSVSRGSVHSGCGPVGHASGEVRRRVPYGKVVQRSDGAWGFVERNIGMLAGIQKEQTEKMREEQAREAEVEAQRRQLDFFAEKRRRKQQGGAGSVGGRRRRNRGTKKERGEGASCTRRPREVALV